MELPPSPPPMVAEPEDAEMEALDLPEPANFSNIGVLVRVKSPMLTFGRKSPRFPASPPPRPPSPRAAASPRTTSSARRTRCSRS